jgi:RNA polymerase sigma-70 factor (ECF subfamily)
MGTVERLLVPRSDEAEALYRKHGEPLLAFVLSRVRDPSSAEDICQETFLAAIARGVPGSLGPSTRDPKDPSLKPGEDAVRWIFAIARNKVLRYHRDRRATVDPAHAPPRSLEPDWALDEREERARVRAAVQALEPELREVIVLRYEHGLDYQETAAKLGVPHSTIQGRLKRARHALRDILMGGGA